MPKDYYGRKALHQEDDPIFCAGDVETEGLGGKLLMIQWGYFGEVYTATGPDMLDRFFDTLLSMPKPAVWFFHFAQYDWRYFLEYIEERELLVEMSLRTDTDIYELRVRRTKDEPWSVMRDSYALWSHPLEKLAKAFCPELPKLEIDVANFDPENPEHVEYAKQDVRILLTGMPRLYDMVSEQFGVVPSATAAGTALKAWQKTLEKEQVYDCQKWGAEEAFIRQGYYGGLVFLTTQLAVENAVTYDLNSSYPASMMEYGVPTGRPQYTTDFEEDYDGIYRVRVRTPDNLIVPILPARNERGAMRWYRGEFETTVTTKELQFAAQHGYEILELHEGYFFEKTEFPFNEFIEKCRFIRKTFSGQTEEQVAKLMQNSLYGKFGSRRERTRLVHHSDLNEETLLGAAPFDEAGLWYVTKELDDEMRCMPHWAVFITANSRLRLLRQVYEIGPENVLYGDTDSITIRAGHEGAIDAGLEYGQWKKEKTWEVFRAIAPKVYSGILSSDYGKLKAGDYMGAAKGLPRKGIEERHWRELLADGATSAQTLSLDSLKVAMKRGVKPATMLTRKSSTLNNSMNYGVDENGNVRVKYAHG